MYIEIFAHISGVCVQSLAHITQFFRLFIEAPVFRRREKNRQTQTWPWFMAFYGVL